MDLGVVLDYYMEYEFLNLFMSSDLDNKKGTHYSTDTLENIEKIEQIINDNKKDAIKKLLENEFGIKKVSDKEINMLVKTSNVKRFMQIIKFKNHISTAKEKEQIKHKIKNKFKKILTDNSFALCHSFFRNKDKNVEHPIISFKCSLDAGELLVEEYFINRKSLKIILAYLKDCLPFLIEDTEIDNLLDELKNIQNQPDISQIIKMIDDQIIKKYNSKKFSSIVAIKEYKQWNRIERIFITEEEIKDAYKYQFKAEIQLVKEKIEIEGKAPSLLAKYILGSNKSIKNEEFDFDNEFHFGSYTDEYSVNKKQSDVVKAAENTELLSVNGPPGTGKTTVLKEIIANTIVKKAKNLVDIWEEKWIEKNSGKNKIWWQSPLGGKNLNSIIVTSTNNDAVDNIGKELLEEINFFNNVVSNVKEYQGTLCARLGNSKNIENFKSNILSPFINKLSKTKMGRENINYKDKFSEKYIELNQLKDLLTKYRKKRSYIEKEIFALDSYSFEKIKNSNVKLDNKLHNYKNELEEINNQLKEINNKFEYLNLEEKKKQLYKKLDKFKMIRLVKFLKIFIKSIDGFLEEYPTKRYIEDKILDIKDKRRNLASKLNMSNKELNNLNKKCDFLKGKNKKMLQKKDNIDKKMKTIREKKEEISDYLRFSKLVNKELNVKNAEKKNFYELANCKKILKKRNQLFELALRVHEEYIKKNKESIVSNLKKINEDPWFKSFYSSSYSYKSGKKKGIISLWETFFMCFPVVTTTLHSFHKNTFQPISNLIDLLLVDESGQVLPHMLVGPLFRSRRAAIVGDVYQIEPIREYNNNLIDKYTAIKENLDIEKYSAQHYADRNSDIYETLNCKKTGIILDEHRRCEENIVKFSNKFIYDNQLKIIKENQSDKLFGKNLVYFDVRGQKDNKHINDLEISACKKIVEEYVEENNEDIKAEIGIITPFKNQAKKITQKIPNIEAGTIHSFQGQEKDIIIISTVIDKDDWFCKFVGEKSNMLNVAFTRAKKQVIIVGNIDVACKNNNYLEKAYKTVENYGNIFSLYNSELSKGIDSEHWQRAIKIFKEDSLDLKSNSVMAKYLEKCLRNSIILNPKKHYELLKEILNKAQKSVYIVSPWINNFVVDNEFIELLTKALERDVDIKICFGYNKTSFSVKNDLNKIVNQDYSNSYKDKIADCIFKLSELLNEDLVYNPPLHTKLLLIDEEFLFVGSHNWLSNNGAAKPQKDEMSCLKTDNSSINYVRERYLNNFFDIDIN